MDKYLVMVTVPAISEQYEILVPTFLQIKMLTHLIANAVQEISGNRYVSSGKEILCWTEGEILLKQEANLARYGIKNGDHLLML